MYVKVNSTRHTAIGTLRFGCVYKVDEKDAGVMKLVKNLLYGSDAALKRITAKKVRAEKIQYLDLTGPAHEGTDEAADDANEQSEAGGE